jgi:hypothetical protein
MSIIRELLISGPAQMSRNPPAIVRLLYDARPGKNTIIGTRAHSARSSDLCSSFAPNSLASGARKGQGTSQVGATDSAISFIGIFPTRHSMTGSIELAYPVCLI